MEVLLGRTLGEHVRLETMLADDVRPVAVDRNQMESALLNLAVNAQQAMPAGGTLRLTTRNIPDGGSRMPGAWVLIEVEDTGTGMSAEVMARAFEPFYTTKPVGAGTGLGLSQVYGFAKQSNGHVDIESKLGRGTSVRLHLPCATE